MSVQETCLLCFKSDLFFLLSKSFKNSMTYLNFSWTICIRFSCAFSIYTQGEKNEPVHLCFLFSMSPSLCVSISATCSYSLHHPSMSGSVNNFYWHGSFPHKQPSQKHLKLKYSSRFRKHTHTHTHTHQTSGPVFLAEKKLSEQGGGGIEGKSAVSVPVRFSWEDFNEHWVKASLTRGGGETMRKEGRKKEGRPGGKKEGEHCGGFKKLGRILIEDERDWSSRDGTMGRRREHQETETVSDISHQRRQNTLN